MKKGLSILLALLMVLTTINVPVFAEDISVGDWSALADALNNANGGTVTLENNIASVSDETSLAEDIAEGGSVTLHSDIVITNTITIPAGVTVEIDLNGCEITSGYQADNAAKHIYPFDVYGNLTIKDAVGNGSISGRGIYVQNGSKVTVDGGAIYGIDSNGGSALWQYGGDIVINGGLVEQKAEGTYNFAINATGGTVTVNGGKVAGNHGAIAAGGAKVVINDGELVCTGTSGMTDNVLYTYGSGTITINGGTYIADNDGPAGGCCVYDANGGATINGGNFSNSSGGDVWGTTGTTIKGGTFEDLRETAHVTVGATITNGGVTYVKTENGLEEYTVVEVTTYEELIAALAAGKDVVLTADITLDTKITVPDDVTIDLNDKTVYVNVENSYYNNATIKNGNIVLGKDDANVCDGYFLVNAGKTLTLNDVNMSSSANGIKGYAVFHLKTGANLDIIDSTLNISNNEYSAGYIVYAGESTATVDINNSAVTGTNVNGIVHATTVINASEFTISDAVEHGINRSAATINDSKVTISGGTGRGITAQHGDLVISGDSVVTITDMDEATIELRNDKNLTIADTATVVVDAAVNNTTSGTITGTVIEPVTGLSGAGTAEDPYLINNIDELKWFRDDVNRFAQDGSSQYAGKYIKLTADIDLNGEEWAPIGSTTKDHGSFYGTFDGDGHTISNLVVSNHGTGSGFFAKTSGSGDGPQAVVKNLKFNNVDVNAGNGNNYAGGVIANAGGNTVIDNVHVTGTVNVSGRGYIGGIVGHGYVKMNNVSVKAEGTIYSTFWCAGGIIGYAGEGSTDIKNAVVEGTGTGITITSAAGGLGSIVGMAEDNEGTQPISGSNLTAKNVNIKTYTGAYGDAYADYALGYLYGGNETSILTGDLVVENVVVETSTGATPTIVDAAAQVGATPYFSLEAAFAAANAGDTVTLLAGVTGNVSVNKAITLDGNSKNVTGKLNVTADGATVKNLNVNNGNDSAGYINAKNVLIENCNVKGGNGFRYCYTKGTVTFKNSTIVGSTYGIHFDGGEGGNIVIDNCQITGWTSFAGTIKHVALKDTTFNEGNYNYIRFYQGATIDGCTFNEKMGVDIASSAESKVEVTNSTVVNGTVEGLFNEADIEGHKIYVDNVLLANPVAMIGETEYATLADAFNEAKANDVVTIIKDGTYELATSGKDLTIKAADGVEAIFDNIGAKNMGGANVTFKNIIFDYYPNVNYTGLQHSGNLTYNNCTVNGQVFLYGTSEKFNNCTFNQNSSDAYNVWTYCAADVEFNNCTFNSAGKSVLVYKEQGEFNGTVKVNDSDFIASASVEGKAAIEIDSSLITGSYDIQIDSDTTATGFATGSVSGNSLWNDKKNKTNLSVTVANEKVWPMTYVAKIGDVEYTSLAAAFAAANAGDKITLLANAEGDVTVEEDKTVTLDLAGFDIVGEMFAITNNGTLTIEDSVGTGNVYTTNVDAQGRSTIVNNGTLTINSGWFGDSDNDKTNRNAVNRGPAVRNYGIATINGGYFTDISNQLIDGAYAYAFITSTGATTTINDAVVYGDINGLVYSDGKTIVNDGSFKLGFEGQENNLWYLAYGDVEIKGGTWNRAFAVPAWNTGNPTVYGAVKVSGGTFNVEIPEANIADGYVVVAADGVYKVELKPVAAIGEVKYGSLEDALNAAVATSGDVTVTLLDNINLTGKTWTPVYFNSYNGANANTIVLDGANKTITGLSDMLFSGVWTGTKLEVKDLTIDEADIKHDVNDTENIGVGAIVGNVSAVKELVIDNCKLTNSHVEGGHWTGGFVGYAAGYSGNDGPVFTEVKITDSEVSGSTIVGKGSVGAIVGHATGDAWTSFDVASTTITGNTITSTGSSTNKAGIVMGTIGAAGTAATTNGTTLTGGVNVAVTENGNTATSNGTVITTVYGRQGSATGVLTITGGEYANMPIEDGAAYAKVTEGYELVKNATGTYTLVEANYVAEIEGVGKYKSLAEAIAAVGAGDVVIELLDDATMDYNARDAYGTAETTSLTINGNGKTLTLNQKNSDWASIGLANAGAKLVLNNMTIEKTGYGDTSGAWNTHAIIFTSNVEMTDVTVNNAIAVENGATLNNVTINEANGYYGLWIDGNGQTVTVNGGAINATNGGRGIKVADEYVDSVKQVTLNVTGTKFNTAKKAAVLVSSTAGAKVTANGADITNVAADSTNFVWVDEDWAGYYHSVKVYDEATKTQENEASFPIKVYSGSSEGSVRAYFNTLDELFAAKSSQIPLSNNYIELRGDVVAKNKVDVSYGNNYYYNFGTSVAEGVTMTFEYADNWNNLPHFAIGENVTLNVPYLNVIGGDIKIAGTLNTTYLYLYGTGEGVTITETGVVNANADMGDKEKTVQVKGGTVLTVNGTLNTSTLNVWTQDTNNSELIVTGAKAEVNASHLHAWNGKDGKSAQKVVVEKGATLTATNFQADRGGDVTVDAATLTADKLTLGYDGNVGKLTVLNNGIITNGVVLSSVDSTVAGPEGMNVTTTVEGCEVVYENGVYSVAEVNYVASVTDKEGNVTKYESLAEAIANAPTSTTVTLLSDVSVDETIKISDRVVIQGNGYEITGTARKTFEVYATTRIENVTINNSFAGGRCIDTRVDGITVTLTNVTLNTTSTGNNQPLTIGGDNTNADKVVTVILTDATINAGVAGYGIIAFVPAQITISNSTIDAFGAIYMKEGTAGSTVSVGKSTLIGTNNHPAASGDFATVVFEESGIDFVVGTDSKLIANAPNGASQSIVDFNRNAVTARIGAVVETNGNNANVIDGFKYYNNAQVLIGSNPLAVVKAEGYIVDSAKVLLGKQLELYVDENGTIEASAVADAGNLLFVATYDGERLVKAEYVEIDEVVENYTATFTAAKGNTVKAFLWKDFASMAPVCNAAVATVD